MGIYDRDYYQDDNAPRGYYFRGQRRMMVTNIVLVTIAIFIIDIFANGRIREVLELHYDFYRRPWQIYQLLTYGFVHASGILHVGLNMFMLWMFGRAVEERLGRLEFLLFYLSSIVFAGLIWAVSCNLSGDAGIVLGASGGVVAVFITFVLYYPKQTVYIWGLLAVPAWVIGAIVIGQDVIRGLLSDKDDFTAWEAHLGGAAFAFLYLKAGLNFSRLLPSRGSGWKLPRSKPKLRIHDPNGGDDNLAAEADRILAKVHREGEESLTGRERRTLEKYSRRVRDRRES